MVRGGDAAASSGGRPFFALRVGSPAARHERKLAQPLSPAACRRQSRCIVPQRLRRGQSEPARVRTQTTHAPPFGRTTPPRRISRARARSGRQRGGDTGPASALRVGTAMSALGRASCAIVLVVGLAGAALFVALRRTAALSPAGTVRSTARWPTEGALPRPLRPASHRRVCAAARCCYATRLASQPSSCGHAQSCLCKPDHRERPAVLDSDRVHEAAHQAQAAAVLVVERRSAGRLRGTEAGAGVRHVHADVAVVGEGHGYFYGMPLRVGEAQAVKGRFVSGQHDRLEVGRRQVEARELALEQAPQRNQILHGAQRHRQAGLTVHEWVPSAARRATNACAPVCGRGRRPAVVAPARSGGSGGLQTLTSGSADPR